MLITCKITTKNGKNIEERRGDWETRIAHQTAVGSNLAIRNSGRSRILSLGGQNTNTIFFWYKSN